MINFEEFIAGAQTRYECGNSGPSTCGYDACRDVLGLRTTAQDFYQLAEARWGESLTCSHLHIALEKLHAAIAIYVDDGGDIKNKALIIGKYDKEIEMPLIVFSGNHWSPTKARIRYKPDP